MADENIFDLIKLQLDQINKRLEQMGHDIKEADNRIQLTKMEKDIESIGKRLAELETWFVDLKKKNGDLAKEIADLKTAPANGALALKKTIAAQVLQWFIALVLAGFAGWVAFAVKK